MPFKNFFFYSILLVFIGCQSDNTDKDSRLENKLYPNVGFFNERAFPDQEFNLKAYVKAKEKIAIFEKNNSKANSKFDDEWITQGPGNIGARINTIAINPEDNDEMYAGFSGGGLFKTEDGGTSWAPIFDQNPFLSIGDITIDKNNTKNIYVGTGDPVLGGFPHLGNGLHKSSNGGATWESLGLEEQRIISKVELHPNDENIIFVASMGLPFTFNDTRGIFRTLDGGGSWEQVLNVSDSTGFTDIIVNPENPEIIMASAWDRVRSNSTNLIVGEGSGIYRSIDGGDSWNKVTAGLPQIALCKTGIAISESEPNFIYAILMGDDRNLYGIYRSDDYGESFTELDVPVDIKTSFGGFGWYFGKLFVDPYDPSHLFLPGVDLYESYNLGRTWRLAAPEWYTYEVHADKHDLQILENGDVFLATDGGLYKSQLSDIRNNWEDVENISATQFYRTAYNPHRPDLYYGGAQDNGSTGGNFEDINAWERIYGGDGFQMVFNPDDPDHFLVETQNGGITSTANGGAGFIYAEGGLFGPKNWDMPYVMSFHNVNTLYTGTDRLFVSDDSYYPYWEPVSDKLTTDQLVGGRAANITTLAESPINADILYVGTGDGQVQGTFDRGETWELLSEELPLRYVTDIKASPALEASAYVTFSGYKDNDDIPRIHRTDDFGATWEDISGNLPEIALNDVFIIPETEDKIIFVGTDAGVYGTINAGANWERLGSNMPSLVVLDLEYNVVNKEIVAATYGRGIMSYSIEEIIGVVSNTNENELQVQMLLYPNPTSDFLNITLDEFSKDLNINGIYNLQGAQVMNLDVRLDLKKIDISNLPIGQYFVRFELGGKTFSKEFSKM